MSKNITLKDLEKYKNMYGCSCFSPVVDGKLMMIKSNLSDLYEFYRLSNGIEYENFRILPFYDPNNPKKTWDSLERANDPHTTKFSLDGDLLNKFFVFAELGASHCAMYDRIDGSIWYEDDEGYHRTTMNLKEFVELSLLENSIK